MKVSVERSNADLPLGAPGGGPPRGQLGGRKSAADAAQAAGGVLHPGAWRLAASHPLLHHIILPVQLSVHAGN